jgi:hypothetical protein
MVCLLACARLLAMSDLCNSSQIAVALSYANTGRMAVETHEQLEAVAILQYVVGRHQLVRDTHLWDLEISLTCSQTCDAMLRTEMVTWTPEPALDLHNPPIAQDAYVYR